MKNNFFAAAKDHISEQWQRSHQKWLQEQAALQEQQVKAQQKSAAYQLRTELASAISGVQFPIIGAVNHIKEIFVGRPKKINGSVYYRFSFLRKDSDNNRLSLAQLNEIRDMMNNCIESYRIELLGNIISEEDYFIVLNDNPNTIKSAYHVAKAVNVDHRVGIYILVQ